jgi:hypothetical protein
MVATSFKFGVDNGVVERKKELPLKSRTWYLYPSSTGSYLNDEASPVAGLSE